MRVGEKGFATSILKKNEERVKTGGTHSKTSLLEDIRTQYKLSYEDTSGFNLIMLRMYKSLRGLGVEEKEEEESSDRMYKMVKTQCDKAVGILVKDLQLNGQGKRALALSDTKRFFDDEFLPSVKAISGLQFLGIKTPTHREEEWRETQKWYKALEDLFEGRGGASAKTIKRAPPSFLRSEAEELLLLTPDEHNTYCDLNTAKYQENSLKFRMSMRRVIGGGEEEEEEEEEMSPLQRNQHAMALVFDMIITDEIIEKYVNEYTAESGGNLFNIGMKGGAKGSKEEEEEEREKELSSEFAKIYNGFKERWNSKYFGGVIQGATVAAILQIFKSMLGGTPLLTSSITCSMIENVQLFFQFIAALSTKIDAYKDASTAGGVVRGGGGGSKTALLFDTFIALPLGEIWKKISKKWQKLGTKNILVEVIAYTYFSFMNCYMVNTMTAFFPELPQWKGLKNIIDLLTQPKQYCSIVWTQSEALRKLRELLRSPQGGGEGEGEGGVSSLPYQNSSEFTLLDRFLEVVSNKISQNNVTSSNLAIFNSHQAEALLYDKNVTLCLAELNTNRMSILNRSKEEIYTPENIAKLLVIHETHEKCQEFVGFLTEIQKEYPQKELLIENVKKEYGTVTLKDLNSTLESDAVKNLVSWYNITYNQRNSTNSSIGNARDIVIPLTEVTINTSYFGEYRQAIRQLVESNYNESDFRGQELEARGLNFTRDWKPKSLERLFNVLEQVSRPEKWDQVKDVKKIVEEATKTISIYVKKKINVDLRILNFGDQIVSKLKKKGVIDFLYSMEEQGEVLSNNIKKFTEAIIDREKNVLTNLKNALTTTTPEPTPTPTPTPSPTPEPEPTPTVTPSPSPDITYSYIRKLVTSCVERMFSSLGHDGDRLVKNFMNDIEPAMMSFNMTQLGNNTDQHLAITHGLLLPYFVSQLECVAIECNKAKAPVGELINETLYSLEKTVLKNVETERRITLLAELKKELVALGVSREAQMTFDYIVKKLKNKIKAQVRSFLEKTGNVYTEEKKENEKEKNQSYPERFYEIAQDCSSFTRLLAKVGTSLSAAGATLAHVGFTQNPHTLTAVDNFMTGSSLWTLPLFLAGAVLPSIMAALANKHFDEKEDKKQWNSLLIGVGLGGLLLFGPSVVGLGWTLASSGSLLAAGWSSMALVGPLVAIDFLNATLSLFFGYNVPPRVWVAKWTCWFTQAILVPVVYGLCLQLPLFTGVGITSFLFWFSTRKEGNFLPLKWLSSKAAEITLATVIGMTFNEFMTSDTTLEKIITAQMNLIQYGITLGGAYFLSMIGGITFSAFTNPLINGVSAVLLFPIVIGLRAYAGM